MTVAYMELAHETENCTSFLENIRSNEMFFLVQLLKASLLTEAATLRLKSLVFVIAWMLTRQFVIVVTNQ